MKKVIETKTGQVFKSIADACKYIGKTQGYVAKMLNGIQNNNTSLMFLSKFNLLQSKLHYSGNSQLRLRVPPNHCFGFVHRVAV